MADKDRLSMYELGATGVILDVDPLNPGLPDSSLRKAQNAVIESVSGRIGALRKRPGLKQFNLIPAGGSILGGSPMAVVGYGSAPTSGGGGNTGSGVGGGDGTGSPGGTTTGTTAATGGGSTGVNGAGAGGGSAWGATSPFIVIANDTNNSANGEGWLVTTPRIASATTHTTSPIAPGSPSNTGFSTGMHARPFANTADRWMYFQQAKDDTTVDLPVVIYRTNGVTTQLVTSIAAYDGTNNRRPVVTAMAFSETLQKLYVAVRDTSYNVTSAPAPQSRIFEIDHNTLQVQTVALIANYTIHAMRWESTVNKLYFGLCDQYLATTGASYHLRTWWPGRGYSGSSDTTLDTSAYFGNPFTRCIGSLGDGVLFMGSLKQSTGGANYNQMHAVALDASQYDGVSTAAGAFTTLAGGAMDTHYAETVSGYSGVRSIVPFNGAIYLSWYNSGTKAAIVKGAQLAGPGTTGLSFTDVWTDGGVGAKQVPIELFVFNSVLYALGTTGVSGNNVFLYSLDGTTWNDVTSNGASGLPATGCPLGILWGSL